MTKLTHSDQLSFVKCGWVTIKNKDSENYTMSIEKSVWFSLKIIDFKSLKRFISKISLQIKLWQIKV